jgi:hypothetical protein
MDVILFAFAAFKRLSNTKKWPECPLAEAIVIARIVNNKEFASSWWTQLHRSVTELNSSNN